MTITPQQLQSTYRLYQILGLSDYSASEEVRAAYKVQALRFHPDKNLDDTSAAEKFRLIRLAYELLSDDTNKKSYDASLRIVRQRAGGANGGSANNRGAPASGKTNGSSLNRTQRNSGTTTTNAKTTTNNNNNNNTSSTRPSAANTPTPSSTNRRTSSSDSRGAYRSASASASTREYTREQKEMFRQRERERHAELLKRMQQERQEQREREREALRKEQERQEELLHQRWEQQRRAFTAEGSRSQRRGRVSAVQRDLGDELRRAATSPDPSSAHSPTYQQQQQHSGSSPGGTPPPPSISSLHHTNSSERMSGRAGRPASSAAASTVPTTVRPRPSRSPSLSASGSATCFPNHNAHTKIPATGAGAGAAPDSARVRASSSPRSTPQRQVRTVVSPRPEAPPLAAGSRPSSPCSPSMHAAASPPSSSFWTAPSNGGGHQPSSQRRRGSVGSAGRTAPNNNNTTTTTSGNVCRPVLSAKQANNNNNTNNGTSNGVSAAKRTTTTTTTTATAKSSVTPSSTRSTDELRPQTARSRLQGCSAAIAGRVSATANKNKTSAPVADERPPPDAATLLTFLQSDESCERDQMIAKEESLARHRLMRTFALALGNTPPPTARAPSATVHVHATQVPHIADFLTEERARRIALALSIDREWQHLVWIAREALDRTYVEMREKRLRQQLKGREASDVYHVRRLVAKQSLLFKEEQRVRGLMMEQAEMMVCIAVPEQLRRALMRSEEVSERQSMVDASRRHDVLARVEAVQTLMADEFVRREELNAAEVDEGCELLRQRAAAIHAQYRAEHAAEVEALRAELDELRKAHASAPSSPACERERESSSTSS